MVCDRERPGDEAASLSHVLLGNVTCLGPLAWQYLTSSAALANYGYVAIAESHVSCSREKHLTIGIVESHVSCSRENCNRRIPEALDQKASSSHSLTRPGRTYMQRTRGRMKEGKRPSLAVTCRCIGLKSLAISARRLLQIAMRSTVFSPSQYISRGMHSPSQTFYGICGGIVGDSAQRRVRLGAFVQPLQLPWVIIGDSNACRNSLPNVRFSSRAFSRLPLAAMLLIPPVLNNECKTAGLHRTSRQPPFESTRVYVFPSRSPSPAPTILPPPSRS